MKASNIINITLNKKKKEVFMSFNKLNRCAFLIQEVEQVPQILISPQVQSAILCEVLAEKGETLVLEDLEISPDDAQRVLEFVSEHLENFMLGALEKSAALQEKNLQRKVDLVVRVSALTPSSDGQKALAS